MADKGITRHNLSQELIDELDALSGGASAIIPSNKVTSVTCGGLTAGTDISNKPLVDAFLQVVCPYQTPDITSFTANKTVYESGTTVSSITFTIKVTKKSNPIASITLYNGATVINTFSNVTNGGTFTYNYTSNITTNSTFKVIASDGTNSSDKTLAVTFVNPMYVGIASGTLTKLVQAKGTGYTYSNITCTNDKVVFKYPASYGNLTSIKDANNFEYLNAFTKTTEVISGVDYNVYTSNSATLTDFKYIFSF